jgi:ribonuclease P/MRP protein subunit RPP40
MELNAKKCKVMHVGVKSAPLYDYHIFEKNPDGSSSKIILEKTTSERDLGVEISSNLKSSVQCEKAATKANQVLGTLRHSFVSRTSQSYGKNCIPVMFAPILNLPFCCMVSVSG